MHRLLPLLILLAGCGGADEAPATADPAFDPPAANAAAYTSDQGTAAVAGTVTFEGKPPPRRPLQLGNEAFCTSRHARSPLLGETVVVGDGGALANVFVHITEGLRGWKFPKASGEVVLDQVDCRYEPHVLGGRVGQTLRVRNSDPIMHNVHGVDTRTGKLFSNWAQIDRGVESTKVLRRPGFLHFQCDVHGWMDAYVAIVRHPFFAVTGADGAFKLDRLPPGTYTIEGWHEKLGTRSQRVTVGDGETGEISFLFRKK